MIKVWNGEQGPSSSPNRTKIKKNFINKKKTLSPIIQFLDFTFSNLVTEEPSIPKPLGRSLLRPKYNIFSFS